LRSFLHLILLVTIAVIFFQKIKLFSNLFNN